MAKQKYQKDRAIAKAQTKPSRGQVGVCATCGAVLEYAGHVNLDLDLRLHREQTRCAGAGVAYRTATKTDSVNFEPDR